jgi:acetyl esterase/lipase
MIRVRAAAAVLVAWSLIVVGPSVSRAQAPAPPPATSAPVQIPDGATERIFKQVGGADLKLYVFKPADLKPAERRPAAIYFAGGGWTNLRVDAGFALASRLASLGLVAITATYRVRAVHNSTPYDSVVDAKSALRWVRDHAADLQIDPARIVGVGDSAGAHVLLTAAVLDTFDEPSENRGTSSKPNALFLTAAVVTTVPVEGMPITAQQQALLDFLGPRTREISPLHHLAKNLPPTVIYHGKLDPLMPYTAVDEFCTKARTLGNLCDLTGFDDAAHNVARVKRAETDAGLLAFLKRLGYLQ